MRLSGLVVISILLLSAALIAQHASGGGGSASFSGSSGSGGSHGGYSGGSGSSASSTSSHSSSSSFSHGASTGAVSSHSSVSSSASSKVSSTSTKGSASPEQKSSRSFFHPFRKSKPVQSAEFRRPIPCLRGSCATCPSGQARNGKGACVIASNSCSTGQSWNGFSCGVAQDWFNNCRALEDQLTAQERQMQGQHDPGQSLRHQQLRNQYEQCLRRFSLEPFGAYAFNDVLRLDIP